MRKTCGNCGNYYGSGFCSAIDFDFDDLPKPPAGKYYVIIPTAPASEMCDEECWEPKVEHSTTKITEPSARDCAGVVE